MILSCRVCATTLPSFIAVGSQSTKTLTGNIIGSLIIDNININVDDRILVNLASTKQHNGIYRCVNAGSDLSKFVLIRSSDANGTISSVNGISIDNSLNKGDTVFVNEGAFNAGMYNLNEFIGPVDTTPSVNAEQTYTRIIENIKGSILPVRVKTQVPFPNTIVTPPPFIKDLKTIRVDLMVNPQGPLVIDNIVLNINDRILVDNFTGVDEKHNGIYYVINVNPWEIRRVSDFCGTVASPIYKNMSVLVLEGTSSGETYITSNGVNSNNNINNPLVNSNNQIDVDGNDNNTNKISFYKLINKSNSISSDGLSSSGVGGNNSSGINNNNITLSDESDFSFKKLNNVLSLRSDSNIYEEPFASNVIIDGKTVYSSYLPIPNRSYIHPQGGHGKIIAIITSGSLYNINFSTSDLGSGDILVGRVITITSGPGIGEFATVTAFSNNQITVGTLSVNFAANVNANSDFSCSGYLQPRYFNIVNSPVIATDTVISNNNVMIKKDIILKPVPGSIIYKNSDNTIIKQIAFMSVANIGSLIKTNDLNDIIMPTYDLTSTGLSSYSYRYYLVDNATNTELEITKGGQIIDPASGILLIKDAERIHNTITITETSILRINFYKYVGVKGVVDKSYVDAVVASGTKYKEGVRLLSRGGTNNFTLSDCTYYNGPNNDGELATITSNNDIEICNDIIGEGIDGIRYSLINIGDRILINTQNMVPVPIPSLVTGVGNMVFPAPGVQVGQTIRIINGIYEIIQKGNSNVGFEEPFILRRTYDGNVDDLFNGTTVLIGDGNSKGQQYTIEYNPAVDYAYIIGRVVAPLGQNINWVAINSSGTGVVGVPTNIDFGVLLNSTTRNITGITATDTIADAFSKTVYSIDRISNKLFKNLPSFKDYFDGSSIFNTPPRIKDISSQDLDKTILPFVDNNNYPYLPTLLGRKAYNIPGVAMTNINSVLCNVYNTITPYIGYSVKPFYSNTNSYKFDSSYLIEYNSNSINAKFIADDSNSDEPTIGPIFKDLSGGPGNTVINYIFNIKNNLGVNTLTSRSFELDNLAGVNPLPLNTTSYFTFSGSSAPQTNASAWCVRIKETSYYDVNNTVAAITPFDSNTRVFLTDINADGGGGRTPITFPELSNSVASIPLINDHTVSIDHPILVNNPSTILPRIRFFTSDINLIGSPDIDVSTEIINNNSLTVVSSNYVSGIPCLNINDVIKTSFRINNIIHKFLLPGPLTTDVGINTNNAPKINNVNKTKGDIFNTSLLVYDLDTNLTISKSNAIDFNMIKYGPSPYNQTNAVFNTDNLIDNNINMPLSDLAFVVDSTTPYYVNNLDMTIGTCIKNNIYYNLYTGPLSTTFLGAYCEARRWDSITIGASSFIPPSFVSNNPSASLNVLIDVRSLRNSVISSTDLTLPSSIELNSSSNPNLADARILAKSLNYFYEYSGSHIKENTISTTRSFYRIKSGTNSTAGNPNIADVIDIYSNIAYDNTRSLNLAPYNVELQLTGGIYRYPNGNFTTYYPTTLNVDYSTITGFRYCTFLINRDSIRPNTTGKGIADGIKSLLFEFVNDNGGIGVGDTNRISTNLTSNGNDPGIIGNTGFEFYIMFVSSGNIANSPIHTATRKRIGFPLDTQTDVNVVNSNVNIWLDCNKPFTGNPLINGSGVVDIGELSNTVNRKRITFGTDIWEGDILVRIGMTELTNFHFSGFNIYT